MKSLNLNFLISSILYLGSYLYLWNLSVYSSLDSKIIFWSHVDFILTILVLYLFFLLNKKRLFKAQSYFSFNLYKFLNKRRVTYLVLLSVIYIYYKAYTNFNFVLFSAFTREDLFDEVSSGYLDMLLPSLFYTLFVIAFHFNYNTKLKVLFSIAIPGILLQYLSRSPLMLIILLFLTVLTLKNSKLLSRKNLRISILSILLVIGASYMTILQGRESTISDSLVRVFDSVFRYRAISFGLSEIVINLESTYDKFLFPFFGFFSEKLISLVYTIEQPIGVNGSDFVYKFHSIGVGYRGNVLYPWWSWFYGAFGFIGLLIKSLYIYIILKILLRLKLYVSILYFLYILLYVVSVRHPVLNASNFYSILSILFLDIFVKYKFVLKST